MAKIIINALASTAGGGVTYLRNVLPRLVSWRHLHDFLILLPAGYDADWIKKCQAFLSIQVIPRVSAVGRRVWWEQHSLKDLIIQQKGELLISLGNFSLLKSPVPQILFCRNELYFSNRFKADLKKRKAWKMLITHQMKTCLANISLRRATAFVTPTIAMSAHLLAAGVAREKINVLPFGFDAKAFIEQKQALALPHAERLKKISEAKKILYVSHYNYFRNFETLLSALPVINEQMDVPVKLVLTTDLKHSKNYDGYYTGKAAALIEKLGLESHIIMLGAIEYSQLAQIYQACDVFACPSYAESFGHPLLEAMANGLPVVAANLPVHREVCEDAALYFDVFNERQLAGQIARVLCDQPLREKLVQAGESRVMQFSWGDHVTGLMQLVDKVMEGADC